MSSSAVRIAFGLWRERRGDDSIDIDGRRSARTTTRGASSANRSRTMNSSLPRAAERRTEGAQTIQATSSPGRYSRVLAASDPTPRRADRTPPNASPIPRLRGTSAKTAVTRLRARGRRNVEVDDEDRLRCTLEAAVAHLVARRLPPAVADLREEARPEEDAVHENRSEQLLDVLGRHVSSLMQDGPRARGSVERERAAYRAADGADLEGPRGADELDDPAGDRLVDED